MTNSDTKQDEVTLEMPDRIWLLKSVVALLGVSDFIIPPEMREHAVEYVRASVAAPQGDAISRASVIERCRELEVKFNWQVAGEVVTGLRQFVEKLPAAPVAPVSTPDTPPTCLKCGHNAGVERTLKRCKARIDGGEALCQCHCEFPAATSTTVDGEQENRPWREAASIVQACLNVHSTYSDAEREFASHLIKVFNVIDQHPDYRHQNIAAATPAAVTSEGEQERETLIYWLLRCYESGHRQVWEPGPNTDETMDGILSVLANRGYDPNLSDAAKALLKQKARF